MGRLPISWTADQIFRSESEPLAAGLLRNRPLISVHKLTRPSTSVEGLVLYVNNYDLPDEQSILGDDALERDA